MGSKNLFFKDEVEQENKQPVEHGSVFSPNQKPMQYASINTYTTPVGTPNEKFMTMLELVIKNNNIPGLDYVEFKEAVEKMKNLPMDESTKMLSVYSIFETQGCTKEVLINSIDKYISLINDEQAAFDAEMTSTYTREVDTRNTQIENSQKEIVELNAKIVELNNFIMTTSNEVQQENMKLKMAESNFKQSAQKVISVMESDKVKITNMIIK